MPLLTPLLHGLLIFAGGFLALALLGLFVCANEGFDPFIGSTWESKLEGHWLKKVPAYLLAFALFGALLCLGSALLASPLLLFKFVLGWSWEKSALPGVLTGIALTILALWLASVASERARQREEEAERQRHLARKKRIPK